MLISFKQLAVVTLKCTHTTTLLFSLFDEVDTFCHIVLWKKKHSFVNKVANAHSLRVIIRHCGGFPLGTHIHTYTRTDNTIAITNMMNRSILVERNGQRHSPHEGKASSPSTSLLERKIRNLFRELCPPLFCEPHHPPVVTQLARGDGEAVTWT